MWSGEVQAKKLFNHGRMGVILFGGAQYSLPEQANLTLIFFFPKIVGERGGGSPKNVFRTYPKKIFRTYLQTIYKIFPT